MATENEQPAVVGAVVEAVAGATEEADRREAQARETIESAGAIVAESERLRQEKELHDAAMRRMEQHEQGIGECRQEIGTLKEAITSLGISVQSLLTPAPQPEAPVVQQTVVEPPIQTAEPAEGNPAPTEANPEPARRKRVFL